MIELADSVVFSHFENEKGEIDLFWNNGVFYVEMLTKENGVYLTLDSFTFCELLDARIKFNHLIFKYLKTEVK